MMALSGMTREQMLGEVALALAQSGNASAPEWLRLLAWEVDFLRDCLRQIKQDCAPLQLKVKHSRAAQDALARIRSRCAAGLPVPSAGDPQ